MTDKREKIISLLASEILSKKKNHPLLVCIDWVDASGKTNLAGQLGVNSPEGYYHYSFNYPALIAKLLKPMKEKSEGFVATRYYDFKTENNAAEPEIRFSNKSDRFSSSRRHECLIRFCFLESNVYERNVMK